MGLFGHGRSTGGTAGATLARVWRLYCRDGYYHGMGGNVNTVFCDDWWTLVVPKQDAKKGANHRGGLGRSDAEPVLDTVSVRIQLEAPWTGR